MNLDRPPADWIIVPVAEFKSTLKLLLPWKRIGYMDGEIYSFKGQDFAMRLMCLGREEFFVHPSVSKDLKDKKNL